MKLVEELAGEVGKARACQVLAVPRSSYYRAQQPAKAAVVRSAPPRALSGEERDQVLDLLHNPRFVDCAPAAVWATLLDEGVYYCSPRTMYRILEAAGEVRERRDQLRHPLYQKPELLAERPNQVWTWDITELRGAVKYQRFYLYVILDLFSRYVVAWMVAEVQSYQLAQELIGQALEREEIVLGQLTIHSDRGATMLAKPLGFMLADLGILKSHSRPRCCNDNPFVESHFRTLKYRPEFPGRFGSVTDARQFCRRFFDWYHHQHRHSGLAWMTPASVHHGQAEPLRQRRQEALDEAYLKNPDRFVRKAPQAPAVPAAVWINPPENLTAEVTNPAPPSEAPKGTNGQKIAHLELAAEKKRSHLPSKPFFQEAWIDDTPLDPVAEVINHSRPSVGLESN